MKVNNTPGVNPPDKKTGKRIAKAIIITGVAAGGIALYRGRKNPALQKFASVINDSVLAPLKQKDVPFKDKISNIGENLKQAVNSYTSKRNNYADIVDIKHQPKANASSVPDIVAKADGTPETRLLALPERATESNGEKFEESLKQLLYKDDKPIFDIPVIRDTASNKHSEILALPAPKEVLALPEKAGAAAGEVETRVPHFVQQPVVKDVIELPPSSYTVAASDAGEEAAKATSQNIQKALAAAAGAGVLTAGGVTAGAVVENAETEEAAENPGAPKAEETEETKAPEMSEAPAVQEQPEDLKSDKTKIVSLNGEEFGGIFDKGIAYDKNGKPLTGKLVVDFESGKAAVVQYENGVLKKSVIFGQRGDEAPKVIKTYKDGRIYQKFEDISLENGAYVAKKTSTYRAADSMLATREVKDGKVTRTKYFKNSTDKEGKINGAPVPVMSTSVQHLNNGVERRKFYAHTADGRRILARISDAQLDGTKHIRFMNSDKKPVSTLMLDRDKNIKWYVTGPAEDADAEGYIYFNDGKVSDVTAKSVCKRGETLVEYIFFEEAETVKDNVTGEETTVYTPQSPDDETVVKITRYKDSDYVKKAEIFARKGDTEPKSTETFPIEKKVIAEEKSHKTPLSPTGIENKIILREDRVTYRPETLKKIEYKETEDNVETYIKRDGSVVEIAKDEQGYVTSIGVYADNKAYHPTCITTFDHGKPVKDTVYDKDGNVIFSSKYSLKPAPKAEDTETQSKEIKREDFTRYKGYTSFNDTYSTKTFMENIWTGKEYAPRAVKEIDRDNEDVYRITLLNPCAAYRKSNPAYNILLDQNNTVQRLGICDSMGESIELFMDEEGHIEADDLKYAKKQGLLTHIGPFKENLERYRMDNGAVIEFVKNADGAVVSLAYYADDTKDIPVCRTFLKNGAPTRDVFYDQETGEVFHNSDYEKDMADVENPDEVVYTNRIFDL